MRVKDYYPSSYAGHVGVIMGVTTCCWDGNDQIISVCVDFGPTSCKINIPPSCVELMESKEEMTCKSYIKQGVIKTDKMQVGEEYNQPKNNKNLICNIITEIDKQILDNLCGGNTDAVKYLYEIRRYYEQCGSDKH